MPEDALLPGDAPVPEDALVPGDAPVPSVPAVSVPAVHCSAGTVPAHQAGWSLATVAGLS